MSHEGKKCTRCGEDKPLSAYYPRTGGYFDSACRVCSAAARRKRYEPIPRNTVDLPLRTQRAAIMELANRQQGCSIREALEATGQKLKACQQLMLRMTLSGLLHGLEGKQKSFRKFATPELAAAFEWPKRKKQVNRQSRAKPKEMKKKRGPAKGSFKPTPITIVKPKKPPPPAFANAEPIYPPGLKITICPSGKDYRFTAHVPPGGGAITQDWLERRSA